MICEMDGGPWVVFATFMFGWRDACPVCQDMDLVVAMTLFIVVFVGWLWEEDLLCCTLVGWFIM